MPKEKRTNISAVSLGSNLGDRIGNLKSAIDEIDKLTDVIVKSNVYSTEPWGYISSNFFLNMGVLIQTELAPLELLKLLKNIERKMGRKDSSSIDYNDRIIDLDILLYNDLTMQEHNLIIPHAEIVNRKFSIVILKDLFLKSKIPGLNLTAEELLDLTKDNGIVTKVDEYL